MSYNERRQPAEIRLGRPDDLESVFRLAYIFGTADNVNGQDPNITLVRNNGNVARIKYLISGAVQYTQTFQYDQLNRLRYAVEHNSGVYNDGARAWYQTCEYDRYGNRGIDVANTSDNTDAANTALKLADFSGANNRITRAGYAYDAAGNLTAEPGKVYAYNAENRLITATVAGVGTNQYLSDGNGRRVKKIVGSLATRFEYGAGGELIAEWNDANTGKVVQKDYFYKGGGVLATAKAVPNGGFEYNYATADHLGTPRAWTNDSGALITGGRHDYLPFGEELFAGYGTRTSGQGYAANTQADGQRNQFGSQERDSEIGLDYVHARYYSPVQGRFTSVDPAFQQVTSMVNPQNWNGYAYAINNPLTYVDQNGKWPTSIHNLIIRLAFPALNPVYVAHIQAGSHHTDVPTTIFESFANEHAMRRPGQTLEDAQKGYQAKIDSDSYRAAHWIMGATPSLYDGRATAMNLEFSFEYFGRAIHPIMDNTSPAHMPFQLYTGLHLTGDPLINGILIARWYADLKMHELEEASITEAQLNGAIGAVRAQFLKVYGEAAFNRAVPSIFRNGSFIMLGGNPIFKANDLGTITIHPDDSA
jgi:RHS repeat-associated protein